MTEATPHGSDPYRSPARGSDTFALEVPYAGQKRMRLTLASGLSSARLRVEPDARWLVAIDPGYGPAPRVRTSASEVRVAWSFSLGDWISSVLNGDHAETEIVLHPDVAWDLSVHGGVSRLAVDLSAGALARLDVIGGCSDVELELGRPAGAVPIRMTGGASHLRLRRPADVGVAVAVHGGISSLRLDDRSEGAIGGSTRLETGGAIGYELSIRGGASDVEVDRA